MQFGADWCELVQFGAEDATWYSWSKVVEFGAYWCSLMQRGARWCNLMQFVGT